MIISKKAKEKEGITDTTASAKVILVLNPINFVE